MSDPQETTENVAALSHSGGEPDPIRREPDQGSDVGGPAQAGESTTEQALTGTSTVGAEDDQHSQQIDPS
jgi:hypothetical protein